MTDESFPQSRGQARIGLLVVLGIAAVLLAAGFAVATGTVPGLDGGGDGTIDETEIHSLQTQEPRCGSHRSSNRSSYSRPVDGGVRLSINETVPVAARDSELTADLDEVGENRYLLDLQRTPGNRSTDCYLEMRYNVTINVTQRNDYTLIRTVDRTFHGLEYADPGHSGASGSTLDPRPPSMNDSEWAAALNASDEYFHNHTDGSGTDSRDDGAAASGASDSGSGSGGAGSGGGDGGGVGSVAN